MARTPHAPVSLRVDAVVYCSAALRRNRVGGREAIPNLAQQKFRRSVGRRMARSQVLRRIRSGNRRTAARARFSRHGGICGPALGLSVAQRRLLRPRPPRLARGLRPRIAHSALLLYRLLAPGGGRVAYHRLHHAGRHGTAPLGLVGNDDRLLVRGQPPRRTRPVVDPAGHALHRILRLHSVRILSGTCRPRHRTRLPRRCLCLLYDILAHLSVAHDLQPDHTALGGSPASLAPPP